MMTRERRFLLVASFLLLVGYARTAATLSRQIPRMSTEDPVWSASQQVSRLCADVPKAATLGFVDGHKWPLIDDALISKFEVQFTLVPRLVYPALAPLVGEDYLLTHDLELPGESHRKLLAQAGAYRLYTKPDPFAP